MHGGNLSLQVHPLTEYIQDKFGMAYTQDESYYLLDAAPDASVYLGLRTGTDRCQLARALAQAHAGDVPFDAVRKGRDEACLGALKPTVQFGCRL